MSPTIFSWRRSEPFGPVMELHFTQSWMHATRVRLRRNSRTAPRVT